MIGYLCQRRDLHLDTAGVRLSSELSATARSLTIFQLGDLHYPTLEGLTTDADIHDKNTPGGLGDKLRLPLRAAIARALIAAIQKVDEPIIAICGDLTDRGDADGYQRAVDFLDLVFSDAKIADRISADRVHIVPGNHDIAFKREDQKFASYDDVSRFDGIKGAVGKSTFGDILSTTFRQSKYNAGPGEIDFLSINTCRGAGATRLFDQTFGQDPLVAAFAALLPADVVESTTVEVGEKSTSPDLFEVLDVPLIHPDDLIRLAETIDDSGVRSLPVVLAHHGIFPQHTPRLNPYSEMVNAGQARRTMASLTKPVVYLHGHIHVDTIEVMKFPTAGNSVKNGPPLVVISAPELRHGFNRIDIEFDSQGRPLGLQITKYRIQPGDVNVMPESGVVRVPLSGRGATSAKERDIVKYMAQTGMANGKTLLEVAAAITPSSMTPADLEDFMKSLVWDGLVGETDISRVSFQETGFVFP